MSARVRRRRHGEAVRRATEALADVDPYGLVADGAPRDEYEPEARDLVRHGGPVTPRRADAVFRYWFGDEMALDPPTARRVADAVNRAVHLAAGLPEHLLPYAERVGRLDDGAGGTGWLWLRLRPAGLREAQGTWPRGLRGPGLAWTAVGDVVPGGSAEGLEGDADAVVTEAEAGRWVLRGQPLRLTWLEGDEADRVREEHFE